MKLLWRSEGRTFFLVFQCSPDLTETASAGVGPEEEGGKKGEGQRKDIRGAGAEAQRHRHHLPKLFGPAPSVPALRGAVHGAVCTVCAMCGSAWCGVRSVCAVCAAAHRLPHRSARRSRGRHRSCQGRPHPCFRGRAAPVPTGWPSAPRRRRPWSRGTRRAVRCLPVPGLAPPLLLPARRRCGSSRV